MKIKQKISKAKKAIKTILPSAIIGGMLTTGIKAEMYDGCSAPTKMQADHRITVSEQGIGYKPIFKYFGKDLFAAIALPTKDGELKAIGGGLGIIVDNLPKSIKAIPVVEYGVPVDGSGVEVAPTVYATGESGRWTIDPRIRGTIFIDKEGAHYKGLESGLTLGVGLTDKVRIAGDIGRTPDGKIHPKGIVSVVLKPGRHVVETYVAHKQVGARWIYHAGTKR